MGFSLSFPIRDIIFHMNVRSTSKIELLGKWLQEASQIVVFTGAGISTESGISDYRSKGGIWDRFRPVTHQEFLAHEARRRAYWAQKKELYADIMSAVPNEGHQAIVQLDRVGKLIGVITQNIDELHQIAGLASSKVLELHGTVRRTLCLDCQSETPWQETHKRLSQGEEVLTCLECGGLLKPATISFGQNLDPNVLNQAYAWTQQCDLLLAVGSTLIVEPAASLPRVAKDRGARLVIINLSATPLDNIADLVITDKAGRVLQKVTANRFGKIKRPLGS